MTEHDGAEQCRKKGEAASALRTFFLVLLHLLLPLDARLAALHRQLVEDGREALRGEDRHQHGLCEHAHHCGGVASPLEVGEKEAGEKE